jgi:hypothetical protein
MVEWQWDKTELDNISWEQVCVMEYILHEYKYELQMLHVCYLSHGIFFCVKLTCFSTDLKYKDKQFFILIISSVCEALLYLSLVI